MIVFLALKQVTLVHKTRYRELIIDASAAAAAAAKNRRQTQSVGERQVIESLIEKAVESVLTETSSNGTPEYLLS